MTIAAIALGLGIGYERIAHQNLMALGEQNNVALARLFANTVRQEFEPFLVAARSMPSTDIQGHPSTADLHGFVARSMRGMSMLKVKIYDPGGRTIFSTDLGQIGESKGASPAFLAASAGTASSELVHFQSASNAQGATRGSLISTYVPLRDQTGATVAVFDVCDDVTATLDVIAVQRTHIVVVAVCALLVLYALLLLLVRRAERLRLDAEAWLRTMMTELEARVAERTTELSTANARLHDEVGVRRGAEAELASKRDLLIAQQSALSAVLKSEQFHSGALDDTLRLITETAANGLCVERVSIWRLSAEATAIQCLDLFERTANAHSSGVQLLRADYPRYFDALVGREEIVADDAHQDPRTSEFSDHYLKPLGIGAMLDTPIVRNGAVVGVLCHEHVGPPTAWTPEQCLFAVAAANLAALAMEQADRSHSERQLRAATAALSADIEDRKRIERELRDSQRLMASLLENTSEGFWHIDNAANTVDVNQAMCALLGRPREEIIGRNIFDFVDAENADVFRREIEARKRGTVGPYEVALQRPDGTNVPCLNNATPVFGESGAKFGSVGLWVDISQIKDTQAQLERAKDDALAASRAKSAFLAAMSHEIRTPLNGIVSIIEILGDGDLRQEQRFQIGLARQAAAQLLNLIGNVLDLSKLESERLELEAIAFDLDDVVQAAADTFAVEASRKGLQLIIDSDRVEHKLIGDPTRLKQIVLNLIGNAIKFTSQGEITVHARCVVAEGMGRLELDVCDTGIGIPADVLPKLTEKFVQASSTTSREYGGSGLGLAICKQLSEAMGGTLRIESESGKGSCFSVSLALPIADPTIPSPATGRGRTMTVAAKHTRLLAAWERLLRSESFAVRCVDTYSQIQTGDASGGKVDTCLLLDESMLDEFAQDRSRGPDDRVLVVVSAAFDATRLQALGERVAHIIVKPLTRAKVVAALAQWEVALPREPLLQAPSALAAPRQDTVPLHGTALVVEDNATNRYVVREHLKRLGWQVRMAEDGVQALEVAAAERFEVVLMDIFMPRMDGLEATRRIREQPGPNQHTPIIALTANAFAEDVRACLEAGMNTHLAKPVSRQALANALQGVTRQAASEVGSEH